MEDHRETDALLGERNEENEVAVVTGSEEPTGCGATLLCDPRRWAHRYVVLFFICFLSFGSYFCYDNPAALADIMMTDMKISTSDYMMFYALYSWPNVIICFFGGFLIDRVFGIRLGAIVFSLIVTGGQVFFALGALVDSYALMNVGRFIFGIGGESLCVAQNSYSVSWFHGRALNMVFGLQLSFSRVGSTVNMNVMQPLYDAMSHYFQGHVCLGVTLFIAGLFCVFSLFCAIVMWYFDRRASRILHKESDSSSETADVINFRDIKDFSIHLYLLCIVCVAYYVAIFPFISLGKMFFLNKFQLSPSEASGVNRNFGVRQFLSVLIITVLSSVIFVTITKTKTKMIAFSLRKTKTKMIAFRKN